MLAGWLRGRVPDPEAVAQASEMEMRDLLFHIFGPMAAPYAPQNAAGGLAERLYAPQGLMDTTEPLRPFLDALSAAGVSGTVHLRSLGGDTTYTFDGAGQLSEEETPFLT